MNTLPLCVDVLVKFFKFFHIYAVRVTEQKYFCGLAENKY